MVSQGKTLDGLVDRLREAELRRDELTEKLKRANAAVRRILEVDIPSVMAEVGSDKLLTPGGHTVNVDRAPKIECPKEKINKLIKWLEDRDCGGIVKRQLIVAFGKNSEGQAKDLERLVKEETPKLPVKLTGEVNYQTLQAWARRRLLEGEEIPDDILNVYDRRVATVK